MTDTKLTATLAAWRAVHEAARTERWAVDSRGVVYIEGSDAERPSQIVFVCEPSGWRGTVDEERLGIAQGRAIALYHNSYAALLEVAARVSEWRESARETIATGLAEHEVIQAAHERLEQYDSLLAPLTEAAERGA